MDKFSELKAAALAATPGPWMKIDYFWIGRAGAINSEFITCDNGPDAEYIKRVSPDAVLALLAELEAKDKRIEELGRANQSQDDHINQQQDIIESLEKKNVDLGRALGAAEKRLATPVRLPSFDCYKPDVARELQEGFKNTVRADGFTVEGDE